MLPEELKRLDELQALFHDAPPSEQELAHLSTRTEELQGMKRRMSEQSLSEEEIKTAIQDYLHLDLAFLLF